MMVSGEIPFYKTLGYVNDGLVAMWDGIYNVGTDTHDSTSTVWVDMVRNINSATFSNQNFDNDCLNVSTASTTLLEDVDVILPTRPYTVEIVSEEVTKSVDSNAASGVKIYNTHTVGYFRHQKNNVWGPANFHVKKLYCAMTISGLTYNQVYPKANKSFVIMNYNPTNTTNIVNAVKVYYNSVLRSTKRYAFSWGDEPTQNTKLTITGSTSGAYKYYNIRIYNRQLSADEIAANYAVDVRRFNIT